MKKSDLEDRLINFAVMIVDICENIKDTRSANHLAGQLIRSGTSPALNYVKHREVNQEKILSIKLKLC
jgi:four helix bundle protein